MTDEDKLNSAHSLNKTRRLAYLVWAVIGIVVIAVTCGYIVGQVWTSISVILFSAFLVFSLRMPVAWMENKGIPRAAGAALSYLLALAVIATLLLLFVPMVIDQILDFAILLPTYVADAQQELTGLYDRYYDSLQDSFAQQILANLGSDLSKTVTDLASDLATELLNIGSSIANGFLIAFVSVIVGFWVLKDLPRISQEMMLLVGPRYAADIKFVASAFSRSLDGYLKGMLVACVCTGTMAGILYFFVGLPYPLVLGVLTGLMTFIPFLGPWISASVVALFGLFIDPLTALLAVLATILPQQITDNFISPRVMAGTVELHPSVILVVLVAGGALGGVFGMLCAIPLTAAIKSIFVYYFEKRTGRHIVSRNGAIFKGRSAPDFDPLLNANEGSFSTDSLGRPYLGEREQRALDAAVRVHKKPQKRPKLKKETPAMATETSQDIKDTASITAMTTAASTNKGMATPTAPTAEIGETSNEKL